MKARRFLALLLTAVMLLGIIPFPAGAESYYDENANLHSEEPEEIEVPIPVTTDGKIYSLFTEENLEEQDGTSFLYVIKKDGRYYTPAHPGAIGDYKEMTSVAAVDITEYWDAATNTFSGIPESANVGVMQYQMYPFPAGYGSSALFLDGNIMFGVSVPFENSGEIWFGSIDYYDREQTYSYSRALWEAKGDGMGYFYDRYTDWYDTKETIYGVLTLNDNNRFALRNFSDEFEAEDPIDVNGYLYAAPCGHTSPEHSAYVAPTCMDKGCQEYWYCMYCATYFADVDCNTSYVSKPIIPALGHDYDETNCNNCQNSIPKYTKITSYEQFMSIRPGASFIAVAEIEDGNGGKEYYVLKEPINIVSSDIDEDGVPDIMAIDENANGTPDILEADKDGDGIADAFVYDGFWDDQPDGELDDMEIEEYLYGLEQEYTDGYMVSARVLEALKVDPLNDGAINVKDLGALEFIMERKIPDDMLEEQYYEDGATVKDYENDFIFRIPNFWVRPMVTIDNNRYLEDYEQGDSKWWGVLFGKDVKEIASHYYDETYPDDAAVLFTEAFYSLNAEGELEHALRFLVNGENKNFIITSYSYYEEIEGTQLPIYLYSSDAGEGAHTHAWSEWTPYTDNVHKRICTVEGCDAFDLAAHTHGTDYTPDLENYELGHWVTCTVCNDKVHQYHTRKTYNYRDYWEDAEDGENHVVLCTQCEGPAEYEEHNWTDWWWETNATGEGKHVRRCSTYACYRYEYRAADEHIYDEGVLTEKATCTEDGVRTYTCIADDCTHSYTETIPATDHDWEEWTPSPSDHSKEVRVCKNDPAHTEERLTHEHIWGGWKDDEVTDTHSRICSVDGCPTLRETAPHNWNGGEETKAPTCEEDGETTFTCTECEKKRTEPISALDHDFGDFAYDSVDSHIRHCKRENCNAEDFGGHEWGTWISVDENTHKMTCSVCNGYQTDDHDFDNGVVTKEPTEWEEGVKTYTCGLCYHTKTEPIDKLVHECTWTDWYSNGNENHKRDCMDDNCDKFENLPHEWDNGKITKEPTCKETGVKTYTCQTCMHTRTEDIPTIDHEFGDWMPNNDGTTHSRFCNCGESETDDHKFDDGEVTQAPTHQAVGEVKYTCGDCGYFYMADIPTTSNHEWGEWVINKLDEANTHIRFCICNESQTAPHNFDEGVVTTEATHTSKGVKTFTCDDCGYTYDEEIPTTPDHEWTDWSPNGDGTHTRACRCNANETKDCTYDDGVVTEEPTHVEPGTKLFTCTVCGYTYEEDIPVLPEHEWGEWVINKLDEANTHIRFCICNESQTAPHNFDEGEVTKEPTHLEEGVKTFTCRDCGYTYDEEIPTTPDHEWTDWSPNGDGTHTRACRCNANETKDCTYDDGVITQQPTHYEEGVKTFTCTVCGGEKTESIAKTTAHEWTEWTPDNDGKTHTRLCKCGASETKDHNFDAGTVTKEPTHLETGVKTFTCSDCGFVREDVLNKTPEHTFGEWKPEATVVGKHYRECVCGERETDDCAWDNGKITTEPTHYDEGVTTFTCTVCGGEKTESIAKTTAHEWSDWEKKDDKSHIRECKCGASDTKDHNFDDGKITKEPTHLETGVKTFTCRDCGFVREDVLNKTPEHTFGEWKPEATVVGKHYRECACGEREIDDCAWDNGKITTEPTHYEEGVKTFTCTICDGQKTESIAKTTAHEWTEWTPDNDGNTHTRLCKCGASEKKDHNFDEGKITKEPTHLEEGVKKFTCGDCGFVREEMIAKTPKHTFGEWKPEATVVGKHYRECACGEREIEDCEWDDGKITTEPTHYEEGVKTFTCTVCGGEKTESIAKTTAHEWGDWAKKDDKSHIRECKCGASDTKDHNFDEGTVTKEPTHLETGVKTFICADCGFVHEDVLNKTPEHTFGEWKPEATVVGKHYRECACGEREIDDCAWDNGKITTEPTHYEEGVKTFTCTVCGGEKTESIPKTTEHEWTEWTPDNDGNTHTRLCKCGASETKDHNFDEGTVTKEPTHLETGVKKFTCGDCGFVREDVLNKTPEHTFGEWKPEATVVGKHYRECACGERETDDCAWDEGNVTTAPTHYEEGVKTFTCIVCGGEKTESIAKTTAHEWSDWAKKDDKSHIRECKCGEIETSDHEFGEEEIVLQPTDNSIHVKSVCSVCGYEKDVVAAGTVVSFTNCEGLGENPLVFVQSGDETTFALKLPTVDDIDAREGYKLIGWSASIDGVNYSAGTELFIAYADASTITFTAEWAAIIGDGEQKLAANQAYTTDMDAFEIEGEGIIYQGDQVFYVPKDEIYVLIESKNDEEVE